MRTKLHTMPEVAGVNRVLSHSRWNAYESEAQALALGTSQNVLSLDGSWKFCLFPSPEAAAGSSCSICA